jgi:hypothetical protein
LLIVLGLGCAAVAGVVVGDVITHPRDLWWVGLFGLGTLAGRAWERDR